MSVAIDCLAAAVNCCLGNINLSDSETLKYMAAARSLETAVESVKSLDQLPNAANNTGRIIYVESIQDYRYSNGYEWSRDFTSQQYQIWSWGRNSVGQLGDGTGGIYISRSSPVSVIGGFGNWCAISAGAFHSLAIRTNGTAWSWGANNNGQLGDGDGTILNRSSPVSVTGGISNWCAIAAGLYHSAALRSDGTAWSWGFNGDGRLGDGTLITRSSPVSVIGVITDWCAIAASYSHSLAIRTDGTAWSWGANGNGQLGDGTITDRSSPVAVVGGFTDWCAIDAGCDHSLAIRANGTAWSWGSNTVGRLGHGTATTCSRSSPVAVVGGINWCAISAGTYHSLAIRTDGTAWSWGTGVSGRLGDGTTTNRSSPVSVVGGFVNWCAISAGGYHSAAIRANGTAWSWGGNYCGNLGDGTGTNRSSPVSVAGGFTDWCAIAASRHHSLAIRFCQGF